MKRWGNKCARQWLLLYNKIFQISQKPVRKFADVIFKSLLSKNDFMTILFMNFIATHPHPLVLVNYMLFYFNALFSILDKRGTEAFAYCGAGDPWQHHSSIHRPHAKRSMEAVRTEFCSVFNDHKSEIWCLSFFRIRICD